MPAATLPETADSPQKRAAQGRTQRLKVTGKLQLACDAMVFDGLTFQAAAAKAGLTARAMRYALSRPHVLAYVRGQRHVLLTSMTGSNILTLADVRDQVDNQMARVQAVKALEQLADEQAGGRSSASIATPGLVVVINTGPTDPAISARTVTDVPDDR